MATTLSKPPTPPDAGPPAQAPLAVSGAPSSAAPAPADSASILLVDDDPRSLLSLRAVLEPLGQRVVTAHSGEEALRRLLHDEFAVILLDMRMPGLDGVETARYINARARTRHIPILFLTAHGEDIDQVLHAYAAGAVDYVAKPFDPDLLRSKVAVFIELHWARAEHVREARARAEAEATASTISKLQTISDAALAHLEMEELLRELLKRTRMVFGADAAGVLLSDGEQAPALVTDDGRRCTREQPAPAGSARALRPVLGGAALKTREHLDWAEREGALAGRGLRAMIAAPLSTGTRTLGALFLCSRRADGFTEEDAIVLRLCADRAAIAVEHARSYERERGLVEVLQHHLLPDHLPRTPGLAMAARYRPSERAAQVGGDWYDAIPLPDRRLGLVIGDVIGHGIGAATLMGELRSALRAYVMAEPQSPAQALASLNRLAARTHGAMVATLLYMVIDVEGFGVRFASAGHLPPLLATADGDAHFLQHASAAPLGVTERSRFEDWEGELAPGSTILLFTDGLVERRDETIDVGLERLRDALLEGPSDLESLCSHVLDRAPSGAGVLDDAALVAVRRLRPPARLQLELPAEPESLSTARHRLDGWLADCGVSTDDIFEIRLAANEACTNAVEHAYGPGRGATFLLAAERSDEEIVVEFCDSGRWRAPRGARRGLGLVMIERLMDAVDVERTARGTRVRMRRRTER